MPFSAEEWGQTPKHHLHTLTCLECGDQTLAELPAGVPRGVFGPRLQAMVSLLIGTQSDAGSRFAERIMTVAATWKQRQRDVLDYLTEACDAANRSENSPSLLPSIAVLRVGTSRSPPPERLQSL
jgi:hypothetical protein